MWHVMFHQHMLCPIMTWRVMSCHDNIPYILWHTTTGCWHITRFWLQLKIWPTDNSQLILKITHSKEDIMTTWNVKWHKMARTKMQKKYFSMICITNTKPKAPDTNLTPGIANIKGYPLALLYPNGGASSIPPSYWTALGSGRGGGIKQN